MYHNLIFYVHLCMAGKVGTLNLILITICANSAQKQFPKQVYELEQLC